MDGPCDTPATVGIHRCGAAIGSTGADAVREAGGIEHAGAAATYQVTASSSLSAHNGPGTNCGVVRYLSYGTSGWIMCQVQGGTKATWDTLPGGTCVSDYLMNMPSLNSYVRGMPACNTAHFLS